MANPTVRCVEFVESVTDWLEGALSDDARAALEEHVLVCPPCHEYLHQLRLSTAALREAEEAVSRQAPPPAAREALLEAFRRQHGR